MKWAEELKKEYSKIARENQGTRNDISSTLTESNKLDTREQIANDLEMSTGTLSKAKYIYNNAPEELIQQLDNEQLSINKAYITLKEQLKSEKEKAEQLEQQLRQEQSKLKVIKG
ncbi:hypothetical protein [Clostridium sp.]|uniref:hypothetical protein n=1 Tax=Clostridium sp. TaxID=1506 RepID=UPI003217F3C8